MAGITRQRLVALDCITSISLSSLVSKVASSFRVQGVVDGLWRTKGRKNGFVPQGLMNDDGMKARLSIYTHVRYYREESDRWSR